MTDETIVLRDHMERIRRMDVVDIAKEIVKKDESIAELEAKHTALNTEYNRLWGEITTLEDGLMNVGEVHDSWNASDEFKKGWAACREQFRELLDSINNPDSDSKLSTLIDKEPAPPPATDDGDSSAGGVGS